MYYVGAEHNIEIFSITSMVQWEVLLGETGGFEFTLHPYLEISLTRSHIPETSKKEAVV